KALAKEPHFIVATPGRIADHLEQKHLFLNGLELLVLDEADRM
ncbi:DEAD/DEAH box helicase, partial [Shewanella sp.]